MCTSWTMYCITGVLLKFLWGRRWFRVRKDFLTPWTSRTIILLFGWYSFLDSETKTSLYGTLYIVVQYVAGFSVAVRGCVSRTAAAGDVTLGMCGSYIHTYIGTNLYNTEGYGSSSSRRRAAGTWTPRTCRAGRARASVCGVPHQHHGPSQSKPGAPDEQTLARFRIPITYCTL